MIINTANLDALRVGFSALFQQGLGQAPSQWQRVATSVPSAARANTYGWLGDVPGFRKWIGPRTVNSLNTYSYSIANEDYEDTIAVDRNAIDDDAGSGLGVYAPRFVAMGRAAGAIKDQLVFAALKSGFAAPCYDGQYFFDTDHPVLDANGVAQSVANTDGGAGTPWFLIDSKMPVAPIILQIRKEAEFVSLDRPTDANVFMNRELLYGVDARYAAGYGFWQWTWGSKQPLDAAHYATARAALAGMKGDHGRPIGVMPDLLVVPPALESAGRKLLNAEYGAGGETNEWKGTAELLVAPWLA
jgi:phage major head subunit gpT-like protein